MQNCILPIKRAQENGFSECLDPNTNMMRRWSEFSHGIIPEPWLWAMPPSQEELESSGHYHFSSVAHSTEQCKDIPHVFIRQSQQW